MPSGDDVFMEIFFMAQWQQLLEKSSRFLRNCLSQVEANGEEIDYVNITVHDLEDLIDPGCEMSQQFASEIAASLNKVYGGLLKPGCRLKISGLL